MDFSIPPQVQDLLSTIRGFMEAEVYPLEQQMTARSFPEVVPGWRRGVEA